jgi:hypothetical protein
LPDESQQRKSWTRELLGALLIAILASGSAPWWWGKVFDAGSDIRTPTTISGSGGDTSDAKSSAGTATAPSPTTATSAQPSGCQLTISNPFASLSETAEHQGQESVKVPPGTYPVIAIASTKFAGRDERWFKIAVNSRQGWIQDNTILIESKSADCP